MHGLIYIVNNFEQVCRGAKAGVPQVNKSENAYVMGAVARESSCGWDLRVPSKQVSTGIYVIKGSMGPVWGGGT